LKSTLSQTQQQDVPRFQSLLKRMDQDNDGRVTRTEFKLAMRRMGCQDERLWSLRLLQRFFEEVEPVGVGIKGLLSIQRLTQFVRNLGNYKIVSEMDHLDSPQVQKGDRFSSASERVGLNNEEEEDSGFFARRKAVADQKLIKKVILSNCYEFC
jgi:hypothetical protein